MGDRFRSLRIASSTQTSSDKPWSGYVSMCRVRYGKANGCWPNAMRFLPTLAAQAEQIVEEAGRQAREMLTDNALVVAAQREAERILNDSRLVGQQRIDEADYYATSVLQDLAAKLGVITQQVDNGIRMLQESSSSQSRDVGAEAE